MRFLLSLGENIKAFADTTPVSTSLYARAFLHCLCVFDVLHRTVHPLSSPHFINIQTTTHTCAVLHPSFPILPTWLWPQRGGGLPLGVSTALLILVSHYFISACVLLHCSWTNFPLGNHLNHLFGWFIFLFLRCCLSFKDVRWKNSLTSRT